ncbi:hypothetical protein HPB47_008822 [Ixodes persulcatus]|uniref:Uncharacterized protein n=1 Tax=Ixodes persulcatus TaxID=34615 RepID=A0AC60P3P8_IXOPE|nr:hypothetical protein HPB47_008822 [Ixodes persulcatus]
MARQDDELVQWCGQCGKDPEDVAEEGGHWVPAGRLFKHAHHTAPSPSAHKNNVPRPDGVSSGTVRCGCSEWFGSGSWSPRASA